MTVSVAMAAYNGERYISEQIDSILGQLREEDELVISLNPSKDKSESIIKSYSNRDRRVKLYMCEKAGVIGNFENAIRHCCKDVIFLSDQDDIWKSNKIEMQLKVFNDSTVGGVCHGSIYIDKDGKILDVQPKTLNDHKIRIGEIIKKNVVQGCTLAFRRELGDAFLPIPDGVPMHDSWIGLCICKSSKLLYSSEKLLYYRQHEGAVTVRKHKGLMAMVRDRMQLISRMLIKEFKI